MRQSTIKEISIQKTVLGAALTRGVIDQDYFDKEMDVLIELETFYLKQRRIQAIKENDLQSKLNEYALN
ncbi:MAG: hypothetical protein ABS938_01335 [Psychrobacillus psychrodurans]